MGLFNKKIKIYAPFAGTLIPLEEVPDEAFAKKLVGDGLAIRPHEHDYIDIYSINDKGRIHLFDTHHVISYKIKQVEVLLHIGINTFSLNREGIKIIGNRMPTQSNIHTPLIRVDYNFIIEKKQLSLISPIIVRNIEMISDIKIHKAFGLEVTQGEHIMTLDIL